MAGEFQREADVERALRPGNRIAMVGLSSKPERDSYQVASYLMEKGFDVVPVNPTEQEILGRTCYPDLLAVPGDVDVVDIFRQPDEVGPIVEEAARIGARTLWLQLGVVNETAARRAREAGLVVVMDLCMKEEHTRRRR